MTKLQCFRFLPKYQNTKSFNQLSKSLVIHAHTTGKHKMGFPFVKHSVLMVCSIFLLFYLFCSIFMLNIFSKQCTNRLILFVYSVPESLAKNGGAFTTFGVRKKSHGKGFKQCYVAKETKLTKPFIHDTRTADPLFLNIQRFI